MKKTLIYALICIVLCVAALPFQQAALADDKCPNCGSVSLSQIDFSYPTCEKSGYYVLKCNDCGTSWTVYNQPATGHNWVETASYEVSCFNAGWYEQTCQNCGYVIHIDIPQLEHKWVDTYEIHPSTCTEHGYVVQECLRCGTQRNESLPLADHTWGPWTITTPATDSAKGMRTRTCAVCGQTDQSEYYPDGTLYPGCSDKAAVTQLQQMLVDLGYLTGKQDGKYGPKTEAAVTAYQTENSLTPDGIAWPATIEAITLSWQIKTGLIPDPMVYGASDACHFAEDGALVLCEAHSSLMLAESVMITGAVDETDRLNAMDNAITLWVAEVSAQYDRLIEHLPDQTAAIRAARDAYMASLQARAAMFAADPEKSRQMQLDSLHLECMRLCGTLDLFDQEEGE